MKTATKFVTYEVEVEAGVFNVDVKITGVFDKGDYPHYPDTESKTHIIISVHEVMPDGVDVKVKLPTYSEVFNEINELVKDEELEYA